MASPELDLARYGASGKADHFLGFWLSLVVEARGFVGAGDARRVRKSIERFLKDTSAAAAAAGSQAFHAALEDGARRYWQTTQTDPSYSSTLFGLKRISPDELSAKVATEAARTVQMIVDVNVDHETARALPGLLVKALLEEIPTIRPTLRAAVANQRSAARSVGDLLSD